MTNFQLGLFERTCATHLFLLCVLARAPSIVSQFESADGIGAIGGMLRAFSAVVVMFVSLSSLFLNLMFLCFRLVDSPFSRTWSSPTRNFSVPFRKNYARTDRRILRPIAFLSTTHRCRARVATGKFFILLYS